MNRNIKLLIESIFDDNADIFDPEKEYMDNMYDIISDNLYKYHPQTKRELIQIIQDLFNQEIYNLNCIDVSQITDFGELFKSIRNHTNINFDVSRWDVGKGTDFHRIFDRCEQFNSDLSKWNVSNGISFAGMFYGCKQFNCDLSKWDVSSGTNFWRMFYGCEKINSDLSEWDVSNGIYFSEMFEGCKSFNQNLSNWNISNGTGFSYMFDNCKSNKVKNGKIIYTVNF